MAGWGVYLLGEEAAAATGKAAAATRKFVRKFVLGVGWRLRSQVTGAIEYALHPDRGIAWGGAFNGQRFRQNLFHNLVEKFAPVAIIETGTYHGTTTEFLA